LIVVVDEPPEFAADLQRMVPSQRRQAVGDDEREVAVVLRELRRPAEVECTRDVDLR
jgi:hypothetical protein